MAGDFGQRVQRKIHAHFLSPCSSLATLSLGFLDFLWDWIGIVVKKRERDHVKREEDEEAERKGKKEIKEERKKKRRIVP